MHNSVSHLRPQDNAFPGRLQNTTLSTTATEAAASTRLRKVHLPHAVLPIVADGE
jgi:hypothetical protein